MKDRYVKQGTCSTIHYLKKNTYIFESRSSNEAAKNKNFLPFHSRHLLLFPELVKFPFSVITFYRALVRNADHILSAFIS